MSSEALSILDEHTEALETINFRCRTSCPRIQALNEAVRTSVTEMVAASDEYDQQKAENNACAAVSAISELACQANEQCEDGPYYTKQGLMPTGGLIGCKLDLVES